jgi:hypothetical protein
MGKLISMSARPSQELESAAGQGSAGQFNCQAWLSAPRERTPSYFPVYSSVSRAMQAALREWVGDWLYQHSEVIGRRVSAYSLLVFSCTRPYSGRPTNIFTYDVQQGTALDLALRTASRLLSERLTYIDGAQRAAGRPGTISLMPAQVADYVRKNRRPIYKMFNIETALMNEILKFTQINIAQMGIEKASSDLRSAFEKHLHRFTDEFDMAENAERLLQIATEALLSHHRYEDQMPVAI